MKGCDWMKWGGLTLICIGLAVIFSWDAMYNHFLEKEMVLSPDSKAFEMWKNPAVPIVMDVYLFNCTNPDELTQANYIPHFVEMGPYSFKEVHEKVDITWNDNNTVTYKQVKRWYFDPENSKGSLKDNVTMLNVLPVAATYMSRYWSNFLVYPLAAALKVVEKTVWVTKTVGEHLFDGYTDPLLSIATSLPGFAVMKLPADKIGFFYGRNGSADYEGTFNMDTGAKDLSRLGALKNWNYKNYSDYYNDECSDLDGSAGDFFPTKLTRNSKWSMFAPDICKTVNFEYSEDAEVNGIPGLKFVPTRELFDNGTLYPEARCNCGGICLPSGVLNVSTCRHGAPGFVSSPHFLGADPYYTNSVSGLKPDPEKHSFQVVLEPRTGIPLDVRARLQINLLLQPISRISMFENMPTLMSPVMWFEDRATLPPELATSIKMVLGLSTAGRYIAIVLILLGAALILIAVLPQFLRRRKPHFTNIILRQCPSIVDDVPDKNGLPTVQVLCEDGIDEQNSLLNKNKK